MRLFNFIIFLFVFFNCELGFSSTEISAQYQSAGSGATTYRPVGGKIRWDNTEVALEYVLEDSKIQGYASRIWRFRQNDTFQPHLFVGLGYQYAISVVPGLGFHLQFGQIAFRMDIYYYVSVFSFQHGRLQTYGLSYTF
ncbi:MAG: hypothetical protein IPM57_11785 [Oligoflexia bacterium]|nr:hypothetical protein [Oligoflexia bacterium]